MPVPTSLRAAFQGATTNPMEVLEGVVTEKGIQLVNDEKMVLDQDALIMPKNLTKREMTVTISGGVVTGKTESGDTIEEITLTDAKMTITEGLQAGEHVELLSFNGGKRYYVLDRV